MSSNSHRVALVHQHVLCFIVSEVNMPCSCYPKAKAIQSRVGKQNNCPSFVTKSTSRIPTEQTWLVSIYTVSIKHALRTVDCGLRTADCGLRTADCGLRTADYGVRTGYKTQTYVLNAD